MKSALMYAAGLLGLICAAQAKADPIFSENFEGYTANSAVASNATWTVTNGTPASTGAWTVYQRVATNKNVEFFNATFAFTSPPKMTHALASAVSGDWDLALNYGFQNGIGGGGSGPTSVMGGLDLLDAAGTGYRIVMRAGDSNAADNNAAGNSVILIYTVTAGVVSPTLLASGQGFSAPGWGQQAGGVQQWRALDIAWNAGTLTIKTDLTLDGTLETSITKTGLPSAWQLSSMSLLSLSSGNTHSVEFDNIVLSSPSAVPEASSLGLLGVAGLAMMAAKIRR